MATNSAKVDLIGVDKGFSKTFKKAGHEASTFSKILKGIGKGLLFLGGVAIAAVIAALAGMIAFVIKAKGVYEGWMKTVVDMTRITGLGSRAASQLAGQFELSGVEAKAGATGVFMFTKALDKARQGVATQADAFKRLHVTLKDGDGKWKSVSTVLGEARDRLSTIKDTATRAGIAFVLLGRGARAMLPWLMKSKEEMAKYTSWLKQAGLLMGAKSMAQFKQYREDQKHVSILWKGFQVNAYRALVPLINQIMPSLIRIMRQAAKWMKKFADVAANKGMLQALRKMVPGFKGIEKGAKAVAAYVMKNWPAAKQTLLSVARALGKVVDWANRNKVAFRILTGALSAQAKVMGVVIGLLRITWSVGSTVVSVIKKIADVVWTVTTGGFNALFNVIQNIISAAQTAYNWLQKLGDGGPTRTPGTRGGGRGGPATGGITTGPMSGYGATLHGTEMVIPMNGNRHTPNRVYDYGGGGAAAMTLNVNVVVPGGTTIIGTAREVAEILAPHVSAAVSRSLARKGRGR